MILIDTKNIEGWPVDVFVGMVEITSSSDASFLSPNESLIYNELNHPNRKNEFLTGRKLFRDMVEEIGWNYSKINTLKDELGKPSGLIDEKSVHLSFTHSNNWMLCALSKKRNVGIDIEHKDRKYNPSIINRLANDDEIDIMPVLKLWTVKEAALKMKGIGIRMDLKSLKLVSNKNRNQVHFSDDSMCDFCTFEKQNHYITLAYK